MYHQDKYHYDYADLQLLKTSTENIKICSTAEVQNYSSGTVTASVLLKTETATSAIAPIKIPATTLTYAGSKTTEKFFRTPEEKPNRIFIGGLTAPVEIPTTMPNGTTCSL